MDDTSLGVYNGVTYVGKLPYILWGFGLGVKDLGPWV